MYEKFKLLANLSGNYGRTVELVAAGTILAGDPLVWDTGKVAAAAGAATSETWIGVAMHGAVANEAIAVRLKSSEDLYAAVKEATTAIVMGVAIGANSYANDLTLDPNNTTQTHFVPLYLSPEKIDGEDVYIGYLS